MSDKPVCRDCADFGPICPNNGQRCDGAHASGAVTHESGEGSVWRFIEGKWWPPESWVKAASGKGVEV